MKTLILSIILGICLNMQAQNFYSRYFSSYSGEYATDFCKLSDGGYGVIGSSRNPVYLKINQTGELLWAKKFPSTNTYFEFLKMLPDTANGCFVAAKDSGLVLLHIDNSGSIVWGKKYNLGASATPRDFIKLADGNLLILSDNAENIYLSKIDLFGNIIWHKKFSNEYSTGGSITELTNGNFILTGTAMVHLPDNYPVYMSAYQSMAIAIKLDADCNTMISKALFYPLSMENGFYNYYVNGYKIMPTYNQKYLLGFGAGESMMYSGGSYSLCVLNDSLDYIQSTILSADKMVPVCEYPTGFYNITSFGGSTGDISIPLAPILYRVDSGFNTIIRNIYGQPWSPQNQQYRNIRFTSDNKFGYVGGRGVYSSSGFTFNMLDSIASGNCTQHSVPGNLSFNTNFKTYAFSFNLINDTIETFTTSYANTDLELNTCNCEDGPTALFAHESNSDTVQFTNNSINADSVVWYFGDGCTSNEFNPSHIYTDTGNYNVQMYIYNTCGSDYKNYTITVLPTNIKSEKKDKTGISIQPNPAGSYITIMGQLNITQVNIVNSMGVEIQKNIFDNAPHATISIDHLPSGIYFVIVNGNKNIIYKIVKL